MINRAAIALVGTLICTPALCQNLSTAGGMSDITVLSVDIGHFNFGNKIIHVFENSRNQTEFRNSPERWRFVIEPLLSVRADQSGNPSISKPFLLDPVYERIDGTRYRRAKQRVLVNIELINDWAKEKALDVVLAAYPGAKCKIGRTNVDVLPITELTLSSGDLQGNGIFGSNVTLQNSRVSFLTSPQSFDAIFDVKENSREGREVLDRFISFLPYIQMNALISFSVKSTRFNLTSITADRIKGTDLYVKLNGEGGVGTVSRTDLRSLTVSAANQLSAIAIVEDPTNFSQELFTNILATSQTVTATETFFDSEQGKQTYNADDLKPDVITRELNKVFTKDSGKDQWTFNSSGSANGNLMGLIGGGVSGSLSTSQLHEFLNERNIENEVVGEKIIAKSIQILQVNIGNFVNNFNFAMEFRNISGSPKSNLSTVFYGRPILTNDAQSDGTFMNLTKGCANENSLLLQPN